MEKESVFLGIIIFIVFFATFLFTLFMYIKRGKKSVVILLLLSIFIPYPLADFIYWGTDLMKAVTALFISVPAVIWLFVIVAQAAGMKLAGCSDKEIDSRISFQVAVLSIWGSLIAETIFINFLLQKFPGYSLF
ncbi:MAG: hypothetical protein AB1333_02640 [Patescibacteria group bacterium]